MIKIIWVIFSLIPSLVFARAGTNWESDTYYKNQNQYDLSDLEVGDEIKIFQEYNKLEIWDDTPQNIGRRYFICRSVPSHLMANGLIDSNNPDYKFMLYIGNILVKKCDTSYGYVLTDSTSGKNHTWNLKFELRLRKVANTGSEDDLKFPKFDFCTYTGEARCRNNLEKIPYNPTGKRYYEPVIGTANVIVPSFACGAVLKDKDYQPSNGKFTLDRISNWLTVGEPPRYSGSSFIVDTDGDEGCKHYTKTHIDFDFQEISSKGDSIVKSDSSEYGFILRDKDGVNISSSYKGRFSEGKLNPLRFHFNYYLLTDNPHGGEFNSVPINITVEYQ